MMILRTLKRQPLHGYALAQVIKRTSNDLLQIEEVVRRGMPRKEAAAAARREFGNVTLTKEDSREVWRWPSIENLLADVGYGLRMLRKSPGSTAAVVMALALGMGMNTTVFSFVNALLLRPPRRVEAPNKLVELWLHNRVASGI